MDRVRMLRLKQVIRDTGLGRSTIYKKVALGEFPRQVKISMRAVAWVEREIVDYLKRRMEDRAKR
jgi:prophage regulatory protein